MMLNDYVPPIFFVYKTRKITRHTIGTKGNYQVSVIEYQKTIIEKFEFKFIFSCVSSSKK